MARPGATTEGGQVQLVTRRRSAIVMVFAAGLGVAACGATGASQVVRQTPVSSISAGTAATASVMGAAPASGSAPSNAAVGSPVNPQTLNQVDAELGALDNSLNQANSDMNNPQGDS
jgi:hypothetical protein